MRGRRKTWGRERTGPGSASRPGPRTPSRSRRSSGTTVPPEDTPETPAREIRVEGAGLLVLVGGALALLTGSFLIGLWVGRAFSPGARAPSGPPVADRGAEPAPDDTGGSYFDAVQGGEKSPEPQRETSPTPAS